VNTSIFDIPCSIFCGLNKFHKNLATPLLNVYQLSLSGKKKTSCVTGTIQGLKATPDNLGILFRLGRGELQNGTVVFHNRIIPIEKHLFLGHKYLI
jgi:hypothetical protein